MPIQVSCPQCQKTYIFPDDRRGKQVRCQDCFQVFLAGKPEAGALSEPPPPPAPKATIPPAPKPAVKPTPKPAARPAPKPAPAPVQKKAPAPRPRRPAAPQPVAEDRPTVPRYRRRQSGRWIAALAVVFLLLLLGGGGTAAVVGLDYAGKLPFHLVAALTPTPPPPPDKTEPAKEKEQPKPDDAGPAKPPDQPDKAKDPLAAVLTKENFDKIDKDMSQERLIDLLGKPSEIQGSAPADITLVWKARGDGPQVAVLLSGGRSASKSTNQPWPVVYPSDATANPTPPPDKNPPPDKPASRLTREDFDKIDKGMTEQDLTQLLGPEHTTVKTPGGAVLSWTSADLKTGILVTMADGKVMDKASSAFSWTIVWPSDATKPPPPDKNPPDKPATQVTEENFDKITQGMSEKELEQLLGDDHTRTSGVYGELLVWGKDLGSSVAVTLRDGKVVDKRGPSARNWSVVWLSPPGAHLTQENFDKIDTGMTEKELTDLLGPIAESRPVALTPDDKDLVWATADGTRIDVSVRKDHRRAAFVAFGKSSSANWPIAWPVNQARFDRIRKGASQFELTSLFGNNPTSITKVKAPDHDEEWSWTGPDGATITVLHSSSGPPTQLGVVGKKSNRNWPVVWPGDVAQNPPPDKPDPRWTQENFDKIAQGMSDKDLIDLLGPATNFKPIADQLVWEGKNVSITVSMLNDKVVNKASTAKWPVVWPDAAKNPPPPPDKNPPPDQDDDPVNQANFDKITKDMTEKDLTRLLGAVRGTVPEPDGKMLCWATRTVNANIVVVMKDGKVVEKRSSMNWPVTWSAPAPDKPPPPPPANKPGATRENYDQIDRGMTEKELTDMLGPVAQTRPMGPGAKDMVWYTPGGLSGPFHK